MKSRLKLRRLLVLVVGLSLAVVICQAQAGWTAKRIGTGGKDLNAVYFEDARRGWVGGDDGFLSHTEDGGGSWVERPLGTTRSINDVYFVSKESGFALAGGTIFSTIDGGHSWREANKFSPAEFNGATPELYSLRFSGKKRGWVVGSTSKGDNITGSILAITRDGGGSWEMLHAPTQDELIHIDFVDERHGWIVGAAGTILHTDDAGESWSKQVSGTKATLYHVDFRNEKRGWAAGEKSTILRTSDGGRSWGPVESPVVATLLSIQFVSDDEGWIVGRGGVILRSGNGGQTWIEQESTTKDNLYALFISKKNGWAVGGNGLILRYER